MKYRYGLVEGSGGHKALLDISNRISREHPKLLHFVLEPPLKGIELILWEETTQVARFDPDQLFPRARVYE